VEGGKGGLDQVPFGIRGGGLYHPREGDPKERGAKVCGGREGRAILSEKLGEKLFYHT